MVQGVTRSVSSVADESTGTGEATSATCTPKPILRPIHPGKTMRLQSTSAGNTRGPRSDRNSTGIRHECHSLGTPHKESLLNEINGALEWKARQPVTRSTSRCAVRQVCGKGDAGK
jgi:hypothetical protein